MTKEVEQSQITFEEFILQGDFIPESENNYLWDDWSECNELVSKNKGLHVYTVIQDENKMWIVEGRKLVNRLGYLFSKTHVKMESNVEY